MRDSSEAAVRLGDDFRTQWPGLTTAEEFAALYERHRSALFQFCLRRTHDPVLAEDIVQDVFERAFAARARFDGTRRFWPWLASIAARECIDVHRRQSYASARLELLGYASPRDAGDATSATVLGRIERERLERAMHALPVRQRIAVQLLAFDGWSHTEIAEQLQCSLGTVRMLVLRGREKLRAAVRVAVPLAVVRSVRARLHRFVSRTEGFLTLGGGRAQNVLTAFATPTTASAALAALAVASGLGTGPAGVRPVPPSSRQATEAISRPAGTALPLPVPAASETHGARPHVEEPVTRAPVGDVERAAYTMLDAVVGTTPERRREQGAEGGIAVSPSYEEDRTIVAGFNGSDGALLMVSHDGGASWDRRPAVGLAGIKRLVLPPAYPRDNRLFVVDGLALRVSRDGGNSFQTVALMPLSNDIALSPVFNRGLPNALVVAGGRLFEYRDDTGMVRPLLLAGDRKDDVVTHAHYGADYPDDPTIYVTTLRHRTETVRSWSPVVESRFSRCTEQAGAGADALAVAPVSVDGPGPAGSLHCESAVLPHASDAVRVPLPRPRHLGPLYAVGTSGLYVSHDEGRTFRVARKSVAVDEYLMVHDVDSIAGPHGESIFVAQTSVWMSPASTRTGTTLLRSDNGGTSWAPVDIDVPGFVHAAAVRVTPTGRIIASSWEGGLACSADRGRTWGRTCPSPDRDATASPS